MSGHFFICYSHHDKKYVTKLAQEMDRKGFSAWMDDRIKFGDEWPRILKDRINKCLGFIIVMSPHAEQSEWVPRELQQARNSAKEIIPLLLAGDHPIFELNLTRYVDVRGGVLPAEEFYDRLRECRPLDDGEKETSKIEQEKRDTIFEDLAKASSTVFKCSHCGFPVSYDSLSSVAGVLLLGIPFIGGVVAHFLAGWLGAAIFFTATLAGMLILVSKNEVLFKEPSVCKHCGGKLRRPLQRYEYSGNR